MFADTDTLVPEVQSYLVAAGAPATVSEVERVQKSSALVLASAMRHPGPLLDALLHLLNEYLATTPPPSREEKLETIHLIHVLNLRRAVAANAANPGRRRRIAVAAAHLAAKAQSSVAPPARPLARARPA